MSAQRRYLHLLLAVTCVGASGVHFAVRAQVVRESAVARWQLAAGVPVERTIATGQSHSYDVTLAAGDFFRIVVGQLGIDVSAKLTAPDGREIASADAFDDPFRDETIAAIAQAVGPHTVSVSPVSVAEPNGRYTIRVETRRKATPDDSILIDAERAFARAVAVRSRANRATLLTALDEFTTAVRVFRQQTDRRGEMKTLIEIGATEYYLRRDGALASAAGAEALARQTGDTAATARVLRLLGNIHIWRGEYRIATEKLEEATEIARAMGNRIGEVRSLNETGRVYRRVGELEKAAAAFERALTLARAANDPGMENGLIGNLGVVLKQLGAHDRAREAYERSLASRRARNDVRGQVVNLINLAVLDRNEGRHADALARQREALALVRSTGTSENEAELLDGIGLTHHGLGELDNALAFHQASLAVRTRTRDVPGRAVALSNIGHTLHRLGELDRAAASLQEALATFRRLGAAAASTSLLDLARVERDRGNLAAALRHIEEAVALEERVRGQLTSPSLRATYASGGMENYEVWSDLLQREHEANPDAGRAAAALGVSERARARVLLESLLEARVDLRAGVDAKLLERERKLQADLADASAAFSRTLAGAGSESERTAVSERLQAISEEYERVEREIRHESPRYAALTQPEPLTAAEIQREVIDEDTVLLEFALGTERSWLWAVTPDAITSVALPPRGEVEAAVQSLYELVTARQPRDGETYPAYTARVAASDDRITERASAVSQMLLGGIAGELSGVWRGKRLVMVAAGALEYVPFAALPVPRVTHGGTPGVPLVARHEIVAVPSASVLATLRREAAARERPAADTIAVIADPVFDAADPRVRGRRPVSMSAAARAMTSPEVAPAHPLVTRALRRMSEASGRAGVARLPFSRDEANAIHALGDTGEVLRVTDFRANRGSAIGTAVGTARIVHFATHGWIDRERPELTGLVLSLVDEHGAPQDGFLRLHDIYNMRIAADLVVLSACQSALGKEIRGEGLASLTRAFMYAGAPRVIASLWQVSDAATAELMKRLYAGILKRGLAPAAALRAAQLEMSTEPRWASPYFWAGFTLQGDWRSLEP